MLKQAFTCGAPTCPCLCCHCPSANLIGGSLSASKRSLGKLSVILLLTTSAALPCVLVANPVLEFIFEQAPDPRYGVLCTTTMPFFLQIAMSGAVSSYAFRLLVYALGASGQVAERFFYPPLAACW